MFVKRELKKELIIFIWTRHGPRIDPPVTALGFYTTSVVSDKALWANTDSTEHVNYVGTCNN